MIQMVDIGGFEVREREPVQNTPDGVDFAAVLGDATKAAATTPAATSATSVTSPTPADTAGDPTLGNPDVQAWLTSYYTQEGDASAANASYQAAEGAGNNYPAGTVYGPDQIYAQALANQDGNAFASLTGDSAAGFTSQLPGIPSAEAQQQFDQRLALENVARLQSGQPIDTTAYWSDPGSITTGGVTYSAQELGYCGPGQSSGPEPIYISTANRIQGTDKYSVPGYTGTVAGIEPGRYYTLAQLQQAGLPSGQNDGQFYPGCWSETTSA